MSIDHSNTRWGHYGGCCGGIVASEIRRLHREGGWRSILHILWCDEEVEWMYFLRGAKDVVKHWTYGTLPHQSCVRQSFYVTSYNLFHFEIPTTILPQATTFHPQLATLPSTIHSLPTSLLPSYNPLLLSIPHSLCYPYVDRDRCWDSSSGWSNTDS